jgi:serine phosphatase RsbU (regulator of sigma subunit)
VKFFKIIFLVHFLLIGDFIVSQVNLDSLRSVWNDATQADTNRLKAIHKIAWDGYLFSNPDSGFYFAQMEYEFALKVSNRKYMAKALKTQGVSFSYQGNYEKALEYYGKSLKIREEIGDKKGMGGSYNNIGIIYKNQGKYEKALEYLLKSKNIMEELNIISDLDETAKKLMEVYEKLGKPQKALENYKLYVIIKDSLAKMDAEKQLYKFEIDKKYELEKQADSIKYENEIVLHQAEVKTQKQRSNGLALIAVIVILSLFIVFGQLKSVKKGKLLVEERNIVIEEKQKEITDSINYAKRLQDGILVPFDLVQSWLSESFILFKPKDIVSGDFYWIEKIGDKIYFAVADCTGHGIPGALVSIICSNALSKSLEEDKIISPAKILDATRKLVEERFVRSADSIKDGMDISLCCLDIKTKTITWSGAMNPIWIVKKDAKEIQELKPDRQAIGMVENPKPFTEHKIKLVVGDSIYLFSDGYIDQFGGLKGKKYMKGKMKKFVISLQNQSMQEQLVSFEKEFNSWKGNRDQIDDVCVMGVKVT